MRADLSLWNYHSMLVFIDDSGDPGFKLDRGSSAFFVIALVIFDDDLEAEKAAVRIKELRRRLGFPDHVEFKFHKSNRSVREQFLRTVMPCRFRVRSLVIDKARTRSTALRINKSSFYHTAITAALDQSRDTLVDARVRIDGSGEREFRRHFTRYVRQGTGSGTSRLIRDCKLVKSHGSVLIQMADMIAGTIRRSYDASKTDRLVYRAIIQRRIEDERFFA